MHDMYDSSTAPSSSAVPTSSETANSKGGRRAKNESDGKSESDGKRAKNESDRGRAAYQKRVRCSWRTDVGSATKKMQVMVEGVR